MLDKNSKIIAIEELLWTYHPLPDFVRTVPFKDKKSIESADILLQTNIKGGKREKKLGNIYQYVTAQIIAKNLLLNHQNWPNDQMVFGQPACR